MFNRKSQFSSTISQKQTIDGKLFALHSIIISYLCYLRSPETAAPSLAQTLFLQALSPPDLLQLQCSLAAQWSSGCDSSSPYKLYWGKIWVLSSHYIFKIIIHPLSHSNPTPLRHTHLAFMTWSFCHCYLSLDHSPLFIKHFGIRLTFFSWLQFLPSL